MTEKRQAPELLIVTIDLGNGKKDSITIREADSLVQLASAFCKKHKLQPSVQPSIEAFLHQNLLSVRQLPDRSPRKTPDLNTSGSQAEQPGVRLYNAGLARMKQRVLHQQQQREAKAQTELIGHTFKPIINKTPPRNFKAPAVSRTPPPVKEQPSQPKNCTFAPAICAKSRRLASSMDKQSLARNVYDRLYVARPSEASVTESSPPRVSSPSPKPRVNLVESVERLYRPKKKKNTSL